MKDREELIKNLGKNVHDRMHELVDEIENLTEQKRLLFEENGRLLADKEKLIDALAGAQQVLELIATPKRPDGTYNYCREACEKMARDCLELIT